jgi:hypothetical protein
MDILEIESFIDAPASALTKACLRTTATARSVPRPARPPAPQEDW